MNEKKYACAFQKVVALLFMMLAIYFIILYSDDQKEVSLFLEKIKSNLENGEKEFLNDYDYLIQIRDKVVSEISLDMTGLGKRHQWGYRVSTIIKKGSGKCGEVTRLIINLFHNLRVPARRVTLMRKEFMHAVIEVNIDGRWILMDTANGPTGFKDVVTRNPRSVAEYFRKPQGNKFYTLGAEREFEQFDVTYYTYFINMNSILYKLFGIHLYLIKPLPSWLIYLLENPPLYAAWISFVAGIIILLRAMLLKRKLANK